jgi:hypothetical protein
LAWATPGAVAIHIFDALHFPFYIIAHSAWSIDARKSLQLFIRIRRAGISNVRFYIRHYQPYFTPTRFCQETIDALP